MTLAMYATIVRAIRLLLEVTIVGLAVFAPNLVTSPVSTSCHQTSDENPAGSPSGSFGFGLK